ncbi:MAG: hypothetical protein AUG49_05000 [Catenulispora sp. 13_1_20CM_3_70_7]|nr:MAG: hypothetical protein AUG49_05000 [Catenulispora sp. 13_1_20CM_3_70_7]
MSRAEQALADDIRRAAERAKANGAKVRKTIHGVYVNGWRLYPEFVTQDDAWCVTRALRSGNSSAVFTAKPGVTASEVIDRIQR